MDPAMTPRVWLGVLVDVIFGRYLCRKVGALGEVGETDLTGRVVLVTGPTSGIGRETAKELVRRGAQVLLACRNTVVGEALVEEMVEEARSKGLKMPKTKVVKLDLSSLDSVRECATALEASAATIDILIGNAGIFSMSGPRETTEDGFEAHFGCNYLAHFLLTLRLLPALKRSTKKPRIVMVSSKLHEFGRFDWSDLQISKGYSALRAYGQSKLAQIMFMYELQRRMGGAAQLQCFSVHPGNVLTEVVRTLPGTIQALYRFLFPKILLTVPMGARATVFAATSPTLSDSTVSPTSAAYVEQSCQVSSSTRASYDTEIAKRLWEVSLQLVGLPPTFTVQ